MLRLFYFGFLAPYENSKSKCNEIREKQSPSCVIKNKI